MAQSKTTSENHMFIHREESKDMRTRVSIQQPRASVLIISMHGSKKEDKKVIETLVKNVLKNVRDSDMCATNANIYLNICFAGLPGNLGPALLNASKDNGLGWTVWASTKEVQGAIRNPLRNGKVRPQGKVMKRKLEKVHAWTVWASTAEVGAIHGPTRRGFILPQARVTQEKL